MSSLKSLKRYSWIASGIVAVIIAIAGLSVSDFTWLPSEYQNYVVMIIGVCGTLAKVFVENARVTRAEELRDEANQIQLAVNPTDGINPEYTAPVDYTVNGDDDGA